MLCPDELRALCTIEYGRGRGIRTPDNLLPKQVRYQTALYPEIHKTKLKALTTKAANYG